MLETVISDINTRFISEAKNSPALLSDMASMEKYMSESYSGRIIVELLQNADDALSSKVLITEIGGSVIFANDGRPFNDADVMAISRSGASEKKRGETIGYRGIGFKSASFLSSDIVIHSNNTTFSFSKKKTAKALDVDFECVPTIRIPFLEGSTDYTDIIDSLKTGGYSTLFIFKFSNKEVLQEEIASLNPDLMLFLRHLQEIKVSNMGEDKLLKIVRQATEWGQEISIDANKWGIVNGCLAFKMEGGELVPCGSEEATYYTFLPTYDKTPFLLKMNGDFSTDPSRKHIRQDEETLRTLELLAVAIADVVEQAFTNPRTVYKRLLQILSDGISFNPVNTLLKRLLKEEFDKRRILVLNNGTKIRLCDYKCFPADFEGSIIHIIRKESHIISSQSLSSEVYDGLNDVENFIVSYSNTTYSQQDIVNLLQEEEFVSRISKYTYSYLLGKIVHAYNRSKLLSTNDVTISNIMIKENNGEVVPLNKTNMTSKDVHRLLMENDNNQSISHLGLKSFVQALGLPYIDEGGFSTEFVVKEALDERSELSLSSFVAKPAFKTSKPIIPKWRSAENACVEIEKFLGNKARDVSTQNLGYDIESMTSTGVTRYIEVKLVSKTDNSFSITNNEYTAAHQYGDNYFICLLIQGDNRSKAIYIQNPLSKIRFEKRIKQWEWYCDEYQGDEIEIDY